MNIRVVGVYVWRGSAYIPFEAKSKSGFFVDREPVTKVELQASELATGIHNVATAEYPVIPDPTPSEFDMNSDRILNAIGVQSWEQLAREGACYTIQFSDKGIRLEMSKLNEEGLWTYDSDKMKLLPVDTPIVEIALLILTDVALRPSTVRL
ncbi:MAG: hypothetical protein M1546_02420 [Chloroflexi bacterium]|nr:hypothetical protein [Chloroflexota bacterium]